MSRVSKGVQLVQHHHLETPRRFWRFDVEHGHGRGLCLGCQQQSLGNASTGVSAGLHLCRSVGAPAIPRRGVHDAKQLQSSVQGLQHRDQPAGQLDGYREAGAAKLLWSWEPGWPRSRGGGDGTATKRHITSGFHPGLHCYSGWQGELQRIPAAGRSSFHASKPLRITGPWRDSGHDLEGAATDETVLEQQTPGELGVGGDLSL
mmetsp:Transcript_15216/g.33525  ORF Transcript_15216/g.33525 Transcript_15216/m.33525 type:complete len:204 (+) Transcript_15216:667-1278(+)